MIFLLTNLQDRQNLYSNKNCEFFVNLITSSNKKIFQKNRFEKRPCAERYAICSLIVLSWKDETKLILLLSALIRMTNSTYVDQNNGGNFFGILLCINSPRPCVTSKENFKFQLVVGDRKEVSCFVITIDVSQIHINMNNNWKKKLRAFTFSTVYVEFLDLTN